MRKRFRFLAAAAICCLLLPACALGAQMPAGIVDGHLHYLDFIQRSDGFAYLAEQMDACGVEKAVIFGMAMAKQWDENAPAPPTYYLSNDSRCYYYSGTDHLLFKALESQPEEIRSRFYPFICGVNPNDQYAADQLRTLLELYPGQIYGIGELMSRHDDLTALTYGEPPHADHPAFLKIFDLAAEYGLPVLIHHNISSANNADPLYLEEMRNALKYNRDTVIIWAHVGISRRVTVENLAGIADTMLSENPNLYYDISWVVYDDFIAKDGASLAEWAALIGKYPTRFILGTDKVGHWDTYPDEINKYAPLIALLDDETAQNLCSGNILRLVDPGALDEQAAPAA